LVHSAHQTGPASRCRENLPRALRGGHSRQRQACRRKHQGQQQPVHRLREPGWYLGHTPRSGGHSHRGPLQLQVSSLSQSIVPEQPLALTRCATDGQLPSRAPWQASCGPYLQSRRTSARQSQEPERDRLGVSASSLPNGAGLAPLTSRYQLWTRWCHKTCGWRRSAPQGSCRRARAQRKDLAVSMLGAIHQSEGVREFQGMAAINGAFRSSRGIAR
jgi:hypothetical protein